MRRAIKIGLVLLACWLLGMFGCHGIKLDGECVYTRTVETTYRCEPDGKIDSIKVIAPEH